MLLIFLSIKYPNPEQSKLISSLNVIKLPPPLALSGRALHQLVSVWVTESLGGNRLGQSHSKAVPQQEK
jgi:hypothetical protein